MRIKGIASWLAAGLFLVLMPLLVQTPMSDVSAADVPAPGEPAKPADDIQQLRADLNRLQQNVAEQGKNLTALTSTVRDQSSQLKSLKADFDRVTNTVDRQIAEQRRILEAISQPDSRGTPILRLRPIMAESSDFRQEMSEAVNGSIKPQGTVRVGNEMGVSYTIRVNGQNYTVAPNASIDVSVPTGSATTELVGYEPPKNWAITAPGYLQMIRIHPRPTAPVVVQRVEIVSPPLLAGPIGF
jgi:hypothetical protein